MQNCLSPPFHGLVAIKISSSHQHFYYQRNNRVILKFQLPANIIPTYTTTYIRHMSHMNPIKTTKKMNSRQTLWQASWKLGGEQRLEGKNRRLWTGNHSFGCTWTRKYVRRKIDFRHIMYDCTIYIQNLHTPIGGTQLYEFIIYFGLLMLLTPQPPSFHSLRHINLVSVLCCLGHTLCAVAGSIYVHFVHLAFQKAVEKKLAWGYPTMTFR